MPTMEPPLTIDDPAFLAEEPDEPELTEAEEAEIETLIAAQVAEETEIMDTAEAIALSTKPRREKFVEMSGGLYLPVRQRIVWMRGEPEPHPDWLIQTEMLQFREGDYQGEKDVWLGGAFQKVPDVKGGMAIFQARVLVRLADGAEGPIIGEGSAMERSESFHDYVEKAETAAIGRALAVAGYGTESALDLDEGPGNLADAPVRVPAGLVSGGLSGTVGNGPINIEPSAIPGVRQGGRQAQATTAQIAAIRERAGALMLSPSALQKIIRETVPNTFDAGSPSDAFYETEVEDNPDGTNDVLGFLAGLTFEDCGKVVLALHG